MLDRRAFLLSGLAVYGASARELFAAGPALQSPKFPTSPFTLGVCSGRSGARQRRAVDAPRDRSVERRRHAAAADRGAVADRDRRQAVARGEIGEGDRVARLGPHGPRGSLRAPAAHVVLVSIPRGQRAEPRRPHADVSAREFRRRSASLRHRVVSALRSRPLHRVSAHGRGRSRSRDASRRLHLRESREGQPRAQARWRRADDGGRLQESLRAVPERSGAAGRACIVPVSRRLGRSRGRQRLRRAASGSRRPGRAVRAAARRRLQGVLRAHAPASQLGSERRAASALPPLHVRAAREHLDARHAAVPNGSALRRPSCLRPARAPPIRAPRCWVRCRSGG